MEENGLEFQKLGDVQLVFGCKLWWKFRSGSSIWANLRASKYIKGIDHASIINFKHSDSRIWRRMLCTKQVVEDNTRLLVRDRSSSFWVDNWIGEGPLATSLPVVPFPKVRISDFHHNRIWHLDALQSLVSSEQ